MENSFIPSLYQNSNQTSPWQIVSQPTVRQVRAQTEKCMDQNNAKHAGIQDCRMNHFMNGGSFNDNWTIEKTISYLNSTDPWSYTPKRYLNTSRQYGVIDDYPPGGYVWQFPSKNEHNATNEVKKRMLKLKQHDWFDKSTRALVHTYYIFNPAYNQYGYVDFLVEFTPSGFLMTSSDVKYFLSGIISSNLDYFGIFCVVLLVLATLIMIWGLVTRLHNHGIKTFKDFWVWHGSLMIIIAITCVILQLVNLFMTRDFENELRDGYLPTGLHAYNLALLQYSITCLYGVLGFLVISRVCILMFSFRLTLF